MIRRLRLKFVCINMLIVLTLLTVENRGEELSKENLENVFRRFYRLDRARSMNHSYGLGLAIAKQIVESHRGKIWAGSRDGINRFCVQMLCE